MNFRNALAISTALLACGCGGETLTPDAGVDTGSASACGDGTVDVGEECDDGNEVAFDGCEPFICTFTCEEGTDCNDGEPCNGEEACTDHVCVAGTALADETACTSGVVVEGVCRTSACVLASCGDGVRDEGELCDDGNNANGDGCQADCTFTCTGPNLDADGDGHAATSLGACGTDCDDANDAAFPGAVELCDGIDNDCEGGVDEDDLTWYVDCDGDGFAASTDSSTVSCNEPTTDPGCAGGTWTTVRPIDQGTTDCNDGEADMFPGQPMYFTTAHTSGASGDNARFGNYNCDAIAQYSRSRTNGVSTSASCNPIVFLGLEYCAGTSGWTTTGTVTCGFSGTFSTCSSSRVTTFGCDRDTDCRPTCTSDDTAECERTSGCSVGSRDCPWDCLCCNRTNGPAQMACH